MTDEMNVVSYISDPDKIKDIKAIRRADFDTDKKSLNIMAHSISKKMGHPELINNVYADIKYRLSFTQKEDFQGKRFSKFVKKAEEGLYDTIHALTHENIRGKLSISDFVAYSVIDYIGLKLNDSVNIGVNPNSYDWEIGAYIEYTIEHPFLSRITDDMKDLCDRLDEICDNPLKMDNDDVLYELKMNGKYRMTDRILLSLITHHNTRTIYEHVKGFVYPELCSIIKEHLRTSYVFTEEMNEANYNNYLPDETESFFAFVELLTRVYIDANNYIANQYMDSFVYYMTQKEYSEIYDQYISNLNDKDEQIAELTLKIDLLQSAKKTSAPTKVKQDSNIDALKEELRLLKKDNEKLKKKAAEAEDKYKDIEEMLKMAQTKNQTVPDVQSAEYEVDLNKHYIFIMDNWTSFMKEIKNTFPNAEFIGSSTNLDPKNVDLVILMPNHVGHPTYYSMKKQCKDKGIKFVHCNKTNIDEIKKVISQVSN